MLIFENYLYLYESKSKRAARTHAKRTLVARFFTR
jgi:hypothetical protein